MTATAIRAILCACVSITLAIRLTNNRMTVLNDLIEIDEDKSEDWFVERVDLLKSHVSDEWGIVLLD